MDLEEKKKEETINEHDTSTKNGIKNLSSSNSNNSLLDSTRKLKANNENLKDNLNNSLLAEKKQQSISSSSSSSFQNNNETSTLAEESDLTKRKTKNEIEKVQTNPKRDKRPEMARYQPPGSRSGQNSNSTTIVANTKTNQSVSVAKRLENAQITNNVQTNKSLKKDQFRDDINQQKAKNKDETQPEQIGSLKDSNNQKNTNRNDSNILAAAANTKSSETKKSTKSNKESVDNSSSTECKKTESKPASLDVKKNKATNDLIINEKKIESKKEEEKTQRVEKTENLNVETNKKSDTNTKLVNDRSTGGLLKLNNSIMSELIAKNDKIQMENSALLKNTLNSSSLSANDPNHDTTTSSNRSIPKKEKRSQTIQSFNNNNNNENNSLNHRKQFESESFSFETTNNKSFKTLYDPNNPNKPIYVQEKASNNTYQQNNKSAVKFSLDPEDQIENNDDMGYNLHREQQIQFNKSISSSSRHIRMDSNVEIKKANEIIQSIQPLQEILKDLVDSYEFDKTSFDTFNSNVNTIRTKLEQLCLNAIFAHLETALNANLDVKHWRCCYHQLIEKLRTEYTINSNKTEAATTNTATTAANSLQQQSKKLASLAKSLNNYLKEGIQFYEKLIQKLEQNYIDFKIKEFIDFNYLNNLESINNSFKIDISVKTKNMKLALTCINRCFISLGDLARYDEMIFASSNSTDPNDLNNSSLDMYNSLNMTPSNQRDYSLARSYYLKAMIVLPKSSRAYHQMAILALYTKRRLDACYYYFRCLETSIPLTSVRQSLNSIFEDARAKSDSISKLISTAILNKKKNKLNTNINNNNNNNDKSSSLVSKLTNNKHRVEIWYKPTGGNFAKIQTDQKKEKSSSIFLYKKNENLTSVSSNDDTDSDTDDDTDDDDSDEYSDNNDDSDEYLINYNMSSDTTSNTNSTSKLNNKCSSTSLVDKTIKLNFKNLKEKKLSVNELNKRFMHNYLNTVGKLFTKVGVETYQEVCSRMLFEFKELLRRQPSPLGKMRLIQITAINISLIDLIFKSSSNFELETTKPQDSNRARVVQRSQLLESAIQLSTDMFVLIVKKFQKLLRKTIEFQEENENKMNRRLNDDDDDVDVDVNGGDSDETKTEKHHRDTEINNWRILFPSIKLFIDWMLGNFKIWYPLPDQLPPDLGPNHDRWQIIANMLNLVNKIQLPTADHLKLSLDDLNLFKSRVKLEEDIELAGFVPLLSSPRDDTDKQTNYFKKDSSNKSSHNFNLDESIIEIIRDKKRVEKLMLFAEYLCGLEQPIMKYDVINKCYIPISKQQELNSQVEFDLDGPTRAKANSNRTISMCSNSSNSSGMSNEMKFLNQELDSMNLDELDENDLSRQCNDNEFEKLKEKKRMLQAKMSEQKDREKMLQMNVQRRLELEIRPKFVVPDTNCFIDHLNLIDRILATNYYIVVIPLLVINELDKLAKSVSQYTDDSIEHAEYVQKNAKKAIGYLNDKFEKRERNLKALTSQGSTLETIQFRSEEVKAKGTTDELILVCCLHYCRDNARDYMPSKTTDSIHLYREVVLLTEDRHLRLKAHTRNVPVKNILHFCRWSNILEENQTKKFNKNKQLKKNSN